MISRDLWVVVLAGGEGRRLSALTSTCGVSVPKQYCSFGRERCMLRWALDRAFAVAPAARVLTVVAEEHRGFWERELDDLPAQNVVVQPKNRGTAAGILLPLIEVARRDPDAVVAFLPSDHHVEDEETLRDSLEAAAREVEVRHERVVLLGISPEDADTEYGWILATPGEPGGARPVERFVEKPSAAVAAVLFDRGALWNSFVFVGTVRTLVAMLAATKPELVEAFLRHPVADQGELEALYREIPTSDFSRDVLSRAVERLSVLAVPPCGWSDLGTPPRLRRFVESRDRGALAVSA